MSDFAKDTNVPTNDCISRQAEINAICSVCGADAECDKSKFVYDAPKEKQVIMCPDHYELTHLPSAQQWVPVTDGLPIDLQVVNITYINKEPATYYDHIKDKPRVGTAVYYGKRFYWYSVACVDVLGEYGTDEWDEMDDRIEVKAWKPLPRPWKGEER